MKKVISIFLVFLLICFLIPVILTKILKIKKEACSSVPKENIDIKNNNDINNNAYNINNFLEKNEVDYNNNPVIKKYDYKKYGTVKLLNSNTNIINELPIDEYLCGVVSAEMPVNFDIEALKAQAIVARTYTIYKIIQNSGKHENADICDKSTCCQAWISKEERLKKWKENTDINISKNPEENWNKIVTAVEETKGKIITFNGQPINAFFHSNSGGKTETPLNVWGGSGYPYLQTVSTSGEDSYNQYSSEVVITKNDLIKKIKDQHSDFIIDFFDTNCMEILEYTDGNRVKTAKIGNLRLSGIEIRKIFSLKSANFVFELSKENITFKVKGYGHGVGMSQTGADSLAKQGNKAEQIINHFYIGVKIEEL